MTSSFIQPETSTQTQNAAAKIDDFEVYEAISST